ncbi:aromatic alcohol reductase [Aspergillus thermomutatus]|uniref:NmrA-like domain-containing protein n=1 Tax=Aspergillus thermomutatus TaxID=41047 RepID=A0A397GIH9_ASPTH|nr:uncharacterized protein CDV56_103945 [Aspergillus thermomutatus]RHZ49498.1 hypothetical protein CDV56_103945 [Aspergillus thermomutatus]
MENDLMKNIIIIRVSEDLSYLTKLGWFNEQGGGSLRSILLRSLLSEPTFKVTVLTRESSKARGSIPSTASVITIADSYLLENLIKAFKGQDAVVNAITSFSVAEQHKFIDAAIAAGVRHYVPSEYALDNNTPEAQELSPVFKDKATVQQHGYTDSWLIVPRSPRNSFPGLHYPSRIITFTDDGEGSFSTTTLDNTALALNRVLLNPSTTANQIIFTSDFATTQKELVETIERLTGEKWERKSISTNEAIPALKKRWENGEAYAGYGLINIGFTKGTYSGHFEPVGQVRNKELGLLKKNLEQVVKEALAEVGHPGFCS